MVVGFSFEVARKTRKTFDRALGKQERRIISILPKTTWMLWKAHSRLYSHTGFPSSVNPARASAETRSL